MPQLEDTAAYVPQQVWKPNTFVAMQLELWRLARPRESEGVVMREERALGNLTKAEQLKGEAESTLADYNKALAEARALSQAESTRAAEAIAAEPAKPAEAFGKRLAAQSGAAE